MNTTTLRLFDSLSDVEREGLVDTFERRHETIEKTGAVLRSTITYLHSKGWSTHKSIWKPCLFLNTVCHDLSLLIVDLVYERNEWRRRFVARILALTVYEIGEDIPSVFGRDFRSAMAALGTPEELIAAMNQASKDVAALWHTNKDLLKEIRTIAAAHRDHDPIRLLDSIDALDLFELVTLGITFGRLLNQLGAASQALINYSSSIKPPELT